MSWNEKQAHKNLFGLLKSLDGSLETYSFRLAGSRPPLAVAQSRSLSADLRLQTETETERLLTGDGCPQTENSASLQTS